MAKAKKAYGAERLAKDIARLARRFPFVRTEAIGTSAMGRPILALRIGDGPFRWHFNGACHANEWITSLLLMRFAEEYAEACRDGVLFRGKPAAELLRRNELWIAPMLNPDGVELVRRGVASVGPGHPLREALYLWNGGTDRFHRWKANARGVDLNDQFPACWEEERDRRGVLLPGPRDYGGPEPLSEPEAKALADWTERRDFHAVMALHTQGEEIYWNYRDREPPESREWARRLGLASGYRPVYLEGSDAGYKDWFIDRFRRPGFTVEAGWGHNPLPLDGFDDMYDDVSKLLAEALDLPPR